MWTDSMVALGWIQGDIERWKKFVRNRVVETRKLFNPEWWRHCPGVDNPADLASRGDSVSTIINTDRWRKVPNRLSKEEEEWPGPSNPPDVVESVKEVLLTEAKSVKERVLNTQVLHPSAEWTSLVFTPSIDLLESPHGLSDSGSQALQATKTES